MMDVVPVVVSNVPLSRELRDAFFEQRLLRIRHAAVG
jgi:hypothetical protein